MRFSIDEFWKVRFAGLNTTPAIKPLPGWANDSAHEESYVQAKLTPREGYSDLQQPVWLIGAPGAVGKSTLAKEICAATGAVYLDLAAAATVAGNYMVGGLVYTGLLNAWSQGQAAVLVDALDEARLRVTQSGFEAFLSDVANVARMGRFPVVLLGRVGIIEETWTILSEREGLEPPIFDIELFEQDEAKRFVLARLSKLSKAINATTGKLDYPDLAGALKQHGTVYQSAVGKVVEGLQELSAADGNQFVGYAPVLDAVAKVIAAETNPARIDEEMRRVLEGEVLISLTNEVLCREASKLVAQVNSSLPGLPMGLYEPAEQLERLACRLFDLAPPALPAQLKQSQVAAYEQAVLNLLPQHPFLDGTGSRPSGAVFAASIVSAALKGGRQELLGRAEQYASSAKHTPNPFLFAFYHSSAPARVPTEHIGILFESVLAKSKPGDTVRLSVEEGDHDLSVEIMILRPDEQPARLEFESPKGGTIRLGRRVSGVSVDAEGIAVELGMGDQLELVAPVSINARSLRLACAQMVVKSEPHAAEGEVVTLEAAELIAEPAISAPAVRGDALLQVSWPGVAAYPWTSFAAPQAVQEDVRTTDALRALRRLVMAFRSHSKGRLARFKDKIEHARMLKGEVGRAVLAKLVRDRIIVLEGSMYYLDPDALGARAHASFLDVNLKRFSPQTRQYVQQLDPANQRGAAA
jgi:hypothetical protein